MRILLVDDAAADVELLEEWLRRGGATVTRAHTDLGAYHALEADEPLDAIITDLNLGFGTTGFDVARAARRLRPDIAVVYVSGEPMAIAEHAVEGAVFVRKGRPSETAMLVLQALRESRGELK
ncbi:response regulator [Phenylobacterium deserti]|uniref:response regulator n=1 Tax=Phenylobacterium deserti TaxID=1914756 RepID=UPI0014025663|nr:response regulator [Phenylobacterium deserti]